MRFVGKLICFLLPWFLKRTLLIVFFKYKIPKSSYIGYSWFYPEKLVLGENSRIGHLNIAIHLDEIIIGDNSRIGNLNWITGFSSLKKSLHFSHQINRKSILIVGNNCAITKRHHLDCTSPITIGDFSTIAGYSSQFLTHSVNITENRQDSKPITIGKYCFISTNVVILGGGAIPDYSVLGAKSLLNRHFSDSYTLYAGVPAKARKEISRDAKYFCRLTGFVN